MLLAFAGMLTGNAFAAGEALSVNVSQVTQQGSTATGVVKDATGETIIGASVVVKGTTNGTITGLDGDFTLSNVKKGAVIVVSYVGYVTQEVVWNGQALTVVLKDDSQALEEVVVVGYGSQKKVNLTGSVSQVKGDVLESRPVQNVSQALQGVIPGLNFSVNDGGGALDNSLSFNIRGTGSIGSGSAAAPLILIDGIEGDMNTVNPNDIANISVLKDAASASIYGARGSFGVILITTKNGQSGKAKVSYSGNVRFSDALQIPEMVDSYTFAQYFNLGAANAGQSPVFDNETMQRIQDYQAGKISYGTILNPDNNHWQSYTKANGNTDWFAENYRNWVASHEHNLSISGGNDRLTYRISGSFMDQNGLIRHGHDEFQRFTLDGKISAKLTDFLTLNYTSKWTREDYERPSYMTGLFFHNIARRWPTCPVYDPNGYMLEGMEIIQMEEGGIQQQKKNYYTQQVGLVFEPIKDWHINVEGNLRTYNYNRHFEVLPVYAHDGDGQPYLHSWDGGADYATGQTRVQEYRYTEDYFTTNIYSDYSKTFGDHYVKAMVGFNAELTKYDQIQAQGDALVDASTPWLSQTTTLPRVSGGREHTAIAGFFGRINYNYKERYMLELNGRYDGSSRFLADKRWGFFPSVSAGWNIARESFFKPLEDKISTLKLRGSWGQLGNTNTNAWYPFYQTMSIGSGNNPWLVGGIKGNSASLPAIVSSLLTWETVQTLDFGFDLNAFNNRFNMTFDWFRRDTKNMVGPAPELPTTLGASVPQINNADMKSVGWELELGWRDRIKDFGYNVRLVLSDATQTVTRYPNDAMSIGQYYNGRKIGEIWGYTTEGIAQTQDQMDKWLEKNRPSWGSNWNAGDVMYRDLNGDGVINQGAGKVGDSGDYQVIGNNTPRYNFGLTLGADWKGFDFSVFFQGTMKRDYWVGGSAFFWGTYSGMWQSTCFKEHLDYWSTENPDGYYPRPCFNNSKDQQVQTRYLQNAAYVRMKNIQLGYTLPKSITNKAGMSSVRLYLSGDNLVTLSDMISIFDPETLGGDWGNGKLYPLMKTISVGLNVNF